ncbi:nicotinate phosphoribosyltransferase [Robertkochia solimangrovi]|uniref:nicotinate phosphoribosyltransferase n=1 Tax=Robertkochia solimangrovi TaxID=2213046 RepID=UPI00117FCB3B|nr:nicotinate phosphoribosyltransferase [Robertkochia solimangrovi]TRZ43209.1 nicotinate phosphoribosyltransferase [Robertkochia solimangrovi]
MFDISFSHTDLYQISMAQSFFLKGRAETQCVFDYFFRKLPYEGGYAIFCGLSELLQLLEKIRFTERDLDFLKEKGFDSDFLAYLKDFRFRGTIFACQEGDVIFPNRPILQVEAGIAEAQLTETLLLNYLNFQSLIATKARRIYQVANGKTLLELGLRRAQGLGGYHASKASCIGGFNGTSNVLASMDFDLPVSGSMAHSYIQSYEDELMAFRDFAETNPNNCVLLLDTYDTLNSGLINAITVAKEMENRDKRLLGVRLDSGDLSYLSKVCRQRLNEAGLDYVKIIVSNQIDEYIVKSLEEQKAPIDIYGVGTSLATAKPDAALDGVYKLSVFDGSPRMKISETVIKTTLPDQKQVYRAIENNGDFAGAEVITLRNEMPPSRMFHAHEARRQLSLKEYQLQPLLHTVMKNGIIDQQVALKTADIARESLRIFEKLPEDYKRFEYPHDYKIGISENLMDKRNTLMHRLKH